MAAVESGATRAQVAGRFGVSRRSVGEWVRAYRALGEDSFRPLQRGRRAGEHLALTEAQQKRILRIIVAGTPDRAALPYWVWTRHAVAELIGREVGVTLRPATVGQYLQRWGIDAAWAPAGQLGTVDEATTPSVDDRAASPVAGEEVRVTWNRLRLRLDPEPAHAVVALTSRGMRYFLARDRPFDLRSLDDLRLRLRMQLARDVRIVACSFPREHVELLGTWLSHDSDAMARSAEI